MMAVFFFIALEKGLKFHAQPQTGAYSCFGVESVENPLNNHSAGKRDRDLTPSPYNARWPEGPRAPLSERSEL